MEYITAEQAARAWGVTARQAQRMLAGGRIEGAMRCGRQWMIPAGAKKPADLRGDAARTIKPPPYLPCVMLSAATPMPEQNPNAILEALPDAPARMQYRGELAYLRGDFEQAKRCALDAKPTDNTYLCACTTAMAAAVSTGDDSLFARAESALREIAEKDCAAAPFARMGLSVMAVSMYAPDLASPWVRTGDLDALPAAARPMAAYLHAKYLLAAHRYPEALAVSKTALALLGRGGGFTALDLYLGLLCAAACQALKEPEAAVRHLDRALALGIPNGFITPFVEMAAATDGLLEARLARDFPDRLGDVTGRWSDTWNNWIGFHNRYARDNITRLLSLREYQVAQLLAYGATYSETAATLHLSVSRVNEIVSAVYDKLLIRKKAELARFIL